MRKNKILLFLLLCLPLCSCSTTVAEKDTKKISVGDVSFNYTYSVISFNFQSDSNVKSYNAFFSQNGKSRSILQNIIPQKEYDFSFLMDGDYDVLFKAFANPGFEDSDSKIIGTVHKFKTEKNVNDITLSAFVTENYSIKINVSNKNQNDKTPVSVRIKKGTNTFKLFEHVSTPSELETDTNLPAGNYKISTSFEETPDSKQTFELTLNEEFVIPKRKARLNDFKCELIEDKIILNWQQDNIPLSKKLTVTNLENSQTFTNDIKGLKIENGMEIPANKFGEGMVTFTLQLIASENDETYISSEELTDSVNISILQNIKPIITAEYSNQTGDIIINCFNLEPGNYKEKIIQKINDSITLEKTISDQDFPIIHQKANMIWDEGIYTIEIVKLASNFLELDSEVSSEEINIEKIELSPPVELEVLKNEEKIKVNAFYDSNLLHFCSASDIDVSVELYCQKEKSKTPELEDKIQIIDSGEITTFYFFDLSNKPKGTYFACASFDSSTKEILGKGFAFKIVETEKIEIEGIGTLMSGVYCEVVEINSNNIDTTRFQIQGTAFYANLNLTLECYVWGQYRNGGVSHWESFTPSQVFPSSVTAGKKFSVLITVKKEDVNKNNFYATSSVKFILRATFKKVEETSEPFEKSLTFNP